jgi:hypothetical protein
MAETDQGASKGNALDGMKAKFAKLKDEDVDVKNLGKGRKSGDSIAAFIMDHDPDDPIQTFLASELKGSEN